MWTAPPGCQIIRIAMTSTEPERYMPPIRSLLLRLVTSGGGPAGGPLAPPATAGRPSPAVGGGPDGGGPIDRSRCSSLASVGSWTSRPKEYAAVYRTMLAISHLLCHRG